jgi:hypothetical protein
MLVAIDYYYNLNIREMLLIVTSRYISPIKEANLNSEKGSDLSLWLCVNADE